MTKPSIQALFTGALFLVLAILPLSTSELQGRRILHGKGHHGHLATFRASLTPHEPPKLNTTERVLHAVKTSSVRSKYIKSRIDKTSRPQKDFDSTISAVGGGYAMSLELGSPPQKFVAIADTGSDLTWVQCQSCSTCIKAPNAGFDPTISSTYKPLDCSSSTCQNLGQQDTCQGSDDCTYTYSYGDQSNTIGNFSSETITLSTDGSQQSLPNFAFGCGLQNQGTFNDVDGLVGLGQGPVSFPSQLGAQYGNIFSYCFQAFSDGPSKTSPIIFGASAVPQGNVLYTPFQASQSPSSTFWAINLQSVSVEGQNVRIHRESDGSSEVATIIDSGTTITELDSGTYQALTTSLQSVITYPKASGTNVGLDLCYSTTAAQSVTFPSLTFHFQNADWVTPWQNVFIPVDNQGTYCLALLASNQGFNIFGNIQQQNFQVIYDQPNQQLGWLPATCDNL